MYFVLSLAIEHDEWHYKLIACVIDLADREALITSAKPRTKIRSASVTADKVQYVIGKSYDMEIESIEKVEATGTIFYKLKINGHRLRVYEFERSAAWKLRTIKCIYNGIGKRGEMSFLRDRAALLSELYMLRTTCRFISKGRRSEDNDGNTFFTLRDYYGLSHMYYGPLNEEQQQEGAIVDLFVEGIDKARGMLLLGPAAEDY